MASNSRWLADRLRPMSPGVPFSVSLLDVLKAQVLHPYHSSPISPRHLRRSDKYPQTVRLHYFE
jgi:hypothetical protein